MVSRKPFHVAVVLSLAVLSSALTPASYLTSGDKDRLRNVFKASLAQDDLSSVAYSVLGFKLLGEAVPDSASVCKKLQKGVEGGDVQVAAVYQAVVASKALDGCSVQLSAGASKAVADALASDASVSNLFYAVSATLADAAKKLDGAATLKTLQAALKKDDSLPNLGFAFQIASVLKDVDVNAIFDRVEDAVVQADEVNGKVLQFEGGLAVTSNIISGAYKLAGHAKVNKAPALTKVQAIKFANYFVSRKSVHQAKGAFHLLEVLKVLTENKFHVPVTISLDSPSSVSEASPKVRVRVSDLLGNSLGKMDVVVESAMRQSDGAVILANSKMADAGNGIFEIDMLAAKPGRGFYELTVTASPVGGNKDALAGNSGAVLLVKALTQVNVDNVELGVADSDQATAPKMNSVNFPDKLGKVIDADHHQKVVLKFAITDKAANERIKVHQAFVRLSLDSSEIIFVAEADSNLLYKFDLDVNAKAKDFGSKSGKYGIHLIIGDSVISNSVAWHLADINLKFSGDEDGQQAGSLPETSVKPEIKHKFREPEVRPPPVVSNTFTLLCLAPILLMFIGWLKIGINVSNLPFSPSSIGFHLGLGAIFGLYYWFWLQLDMFATLKYLIMIGIVTFLCGNSILVKIAEKRKQN